MTVAVCSRSPLLMLYRPGSGLWFHSYCGPSGPEVKVSVPVIGATVFVVLIAGLGRWRPSGR